MGGRFFISLLLRFPLQWPKDIGVGGSSAKIIWGIGSCEDFKMKRTFLTEAHLPFFPSLLNTPHVKVFFLTVVNKYSIPFTI